MGATPVCHLIESDGPYGAERVVLALAQQSRAGAAFQATVSCLVKDVERPHPVGEAAAAIGVPFLPVRLRNRDLLVDLARLVRVLKRSGAGLLHTHGYKATLAGYAAHRATGVPMLATCHLWFEERDAKWTYRALSSLERRVYPRLPRVVAVSDALGEILVARGVERSRVRVIYNGIPVAHAAPPPGQRQDLRRRFNTPPDGFMVVNVGRLSEQKAQHDLVAAIAQLRAERHPATAVILGEGHLRGALEQLVERLSLQGVVHLPGFQKDVMAHLRAGDAFALPSLDEGLPIALLDAFVAGLPAVCTAVGAVPAVVTDNENGLIVPVGSPAALAAALRRLIEDPELRTRLVAKATQTLHDRFTAEAMYRQYRQVYEDVLESARRR